MNQGQREEFLARVSAIRSDDSKGYQDVFAISLTSLLGAPVPLFCALHLSEESDLLICEFENEHDVFNSTHPPNNGLPDKPVHVLDHQVTEAERLSSTISRSAALRSVQLARKVSRQLSPMELFRILTEIQGQLSTASSLSTLLDIVVGLVYELTSFHRTMIYQFDENSSGTH